MREPQQLSVRNLSIMFGGVHAVEDVSFDVEPGEVFAIIGPNGAGKSTIFNLISRLYEPSAGSIHYGEQNLLQLPAHEVVQTGIARTFQNIELFEPYDYVVLPNGSCTAMMRVEYLHYLENEPAWFERAKALAEKTFELSEFLVRCANWQPAASPDAPTVTFHASCQAHPRYP